MPTSPGFRIGRVFGIPIYVHSTWIFIFALLTASLRGQFGNEHREWSSSQLWSVAVATSLIFFGSVLFHELSHSVVALAYKIRVVSITLFFFGGLARIGREPAKAIQEFNIAIAGPAASFFLATLFWILVIVTPGEMVGAPGKYLAGANFMLAAFNLLPGFPLDGARIFRAILWAITKDFSRATKAAGTAGKLVASSVIAAGVWYGFHQDWLSMLVLTVVGLFLLSAAQESVAQVTIREVLAGLHAADVMSHEVPTIPRDVSLEEYGQEVSRTGRRCHLVVGDDRLVGMMNVHSLNSVPREEWPHMSVQAVMIPREKVLWARPEEPLLGLLERLVSADINQMPVVSGSENGGSHIVGMITRDSILRVMQARSEVGPPSTAR